MPYLYKKDNQHYIPPQMRIDDTDILYECAEQTGQINKLTGKYRQEMRELREYEKGTK